MIILTIILVQVLCCHLIIKITRNGINGAMFVTSSGNSIAPVDMMKLVKEAMTEHQTFSRVLYVLALGTPITLLIARYNQVILLS